jgi:hypothetical protein
VYETLLSWPEHLHVSAFVRACTDHAIGYLYGGHPEAWTVRVWCIDEYWQRPITARMFSNRHGVPEEAVLRAAMGDGQCAGKRLQVWTSPRVPSRSHGLICCDGTNAKFTSCAEAARFIGPKAWDTNILQALLGDIAKAYGLRWWREVEGVRVTPRRTVPPAKSSPVLWRGTRYPSIKAAASAVPGVTRRQVEYGARRLSA